MRWGFKREKYDPMYIHEEIFIFCCSIENKPLSSQSAGEKKPITLICPLEDENLKILTLELIPSRLSKKSAKTTKEFWHSF